MEWFKNFVTNKLVTAIGIPTGATGLAFVGYLAYALSDGHLSSDEIDTLLKIIGVDILKIPGFFS